MTNLMTIETAFLNQETTKNFFKIKEAKQLQSKIETSDKKRFAQSIEYAKIIHEAEQNFESETGKRLLTESGLAWKKEEFFQKTFGIQKSFAYRLIKCAKLGDEKLEEFNAYVDENKDKGVSRSLKTFIKWAKGEDVTEGAEGEGEGEGSEENAKCIFTMSFRRADIDGGKNISVRIKADGSVEGSTAEEIQLAIAFLQSKLS
jgi:hypothetical protein